MACAFSLTMLASCGNKSTESNATTDSTATENTEAAAPTAEAEQTEDVAKTLESQVANKNAKGLETTINTVQAKYAALVKEGKVEEAKAYAAKAQEYLNQHASEIATIASGNTTVNDLINTVKNLPTSAKTTAEEAAAAAIPNNTLAVA